jgi:hypothetical protein
MRIMPGGRNDDHGPATRTSDCATTARGGDTGLGGPGAVACPRATHGSFGYRAARSAALKLPTIEDLLRAEDAGIPAEIVNGELVQKAMGTARQEGDPWKP